jgi:hypothetical protein
VPLASGIVRGVEVGCAPTSDPTPHVGVII